MDNALEQLLTKAYDYKQNYEKKVEEAAIIIKQNLGYAERYTWVAPEFGLVLGSGLGRLADEIKNPKVIPYEYISNFPKTTVPGHEGKLIYGTIEGVSVIALQGRKHYYEVADEPFNNGVLQTVFPVHVLAELGVKNYFATNAAGGLNGNYNVGDLMVLKTHINLIPNPLLGKKHNFKTLNGEETARFQPMNGAYDEELTNFLFNAGNPHFMFGTYGKDMHRGTYMAVTGPSFETNGESIAFRNLGADAVGMSTSPEVIVARNRGMKCVAMSCITNKIDADGTNATSHEEVEAILKSERTKDRLISVIRNFFSHYRNLYK